MMPLPEPQPTPTPTHHQHGSVTPASQPGRSALVHTVSLTGNHTPVNLDALTINLSGRHPQIWLLDGMTGDGASIWHRTDRRAVEPSRRELKSGYIVEELPGRVIARLEETIGTPLAWKFSPTSVLKVEHIEKGLNLFRRLLQADPDAATSVSMLVLGDFCLRPGKSLDRNPFFEINGIKLDEGGRLVSASGGELPKEFTPEQFFARSVPVFGTKTFRPELVQKGALAHFRGRSPENIFAGLFDPLAIQVYQNVRNAIRFSLEAVKTDFLAAFGGASGREPGGAVGVGVIKVAPGTVALVAWGDSEIGFAQDGTPKYLYGGVPAALNPRGKLVDYASISTSSGKMQIQVPGAVDVRIMRVDDLRNSVIFGFTDGCYPKGHLPSLMTRLEGYLDTPERLIGRLAELDPWIVANTGGPLRADDRTAFALRGSDLL